MRILLTNDDGYMAPGLIRLESELEKCGHEVFVAAPTCEKSMNSHALTFPGASKIKCLDSHHIIFDAMPADCIYMTFSEGLFSVDFDCVISGINKGYNLSADILFSGTYNAAQESSLFGCKAIAVAAENNSDIEVTYGKAASFISLMLPSLLPVLTPSFVLNINVPGWGNISDYEISCLGEMKHKDKNHLGDEAHAAYFSKDEKYNGLRTDHSVVNDGRISLTPVNVSPALNEKALSLLKLCKI